MTAAPAAFRSSAVPASDGDLLAAAAAGDRDALGELARRYVDFVYAAAVRQTRDHHVAEDVTQAVFLVLAKKAGSVRGPALAAWLHRTTGYAAANHRRAAARRRKYEHAAARPEAMMPTPIADPDPLLPLLDDAIASLGGRDRGLVIERYLRGRDLADVAAGLNASPAAVQKRLERTVGKLRHYFARRGVGVGPRGAALTPAVIAGALLAVAPSPGSAASPTLVAGVVSAVTTPAAASAASIATAQGVLTMLTTTKLKIAAAVLLATTLVGGAGVEGVRRLAAVSAEPPSASMSASMSASTASAGAEGATEKTGDLSAAGVATLPDGTTVRLAGIADLDARDKLWGPDGSAITVPWHIPKEADGIRRTDGEAMRPHFGIVLDVHGPGVDAPEVTSFGFDGGFGADGGFKPRVNGDAVAPHLDGIVNSFKPTQTTSTMKFYIAAGPYLPPAQKPTIFGGSGGSSSSWSTPDGHYVVGKPFLRDGAFAYTVSYTVGDVQKRLRLAWVDRAGQERWLPGRIVEGTSAGPVVQETFVFDGATDARRLTYLAPPVMEFRPIYTVEFHDVSLKPGVATSVTANVLSPATQPVAASTDFATAPFPKLAPFMGLRFTCDNAEVRIHDTWFAWVALNDRPVADLVAAAKAWEPRLWQKRVGEDLVELCARGGRPVGPKVWLTLRSAGGGPDITLSGVDMTEANRRSVYVPRTW